MSGHDGMLCKKQQAGFLMFEAVIAIVLLGLIAGSFFMPLTVILRSMHDMQYHLDAYLIANSAMEKELAYWRAHGLSALKRQIDTHASFTCQPCTAASSHEADNVYNNRKKVTAYVLTSALTPYMAQKGAYQLSVHVLGKGKGYLTTLITKNSH